MGEVYSKKGYQKLQVQAVQVDEGHLLGQGPPAEGLHCLEHLLGHGADGLVGVAVAQEETHHLGRLALADPGGVQGYGHFPHVHQAAGVGLKKSRVILALPVPRNLQVHLAEGGLQPAGVVAVPAASVCLQERRPVQLQDGL
jgi:hypothetical protein